jgi:hypothetical protein
VLARAQNPDDRESFAEIQAEMERNNFSILRDVDVSRVKAFQADKSQKTMQRRRVSDSVNRDQMACVFE